MSSNVSSPRSTEGSNGYLQLGGTKKNYVSSIKNDSFTSSVLESSFDVTFELAEVPSIREGSSIMVVHDNPVLTTQQVVPSSKETLNPLLTASPQPIVNSGFVKPCSQFKSLPRPLGSTLSSVEAFSTPNSSRSSLTSSSVTPSTSFKNTALNSRSENTSFDTPGSVASRTSTLSSGAASVASATNRDLNGNFVVALVEFHNRQQVGIAAFDTTNSKVYLSQFSDNHMYTNTLSLLNCYDPQIILMSDTAADSILCQIVRRDVRISVQTYNGNGLPVLL